MPIADPLVSHRDATRSLALALKPTAVYRWLLASGYYPESYVLPPCFAVTAHPQRLKCYFKIGKAGSRQTFRPDRHECAHVHFPKSNVTDRTFGVIHPHIHNDIAYHIARNWHSIVDALIPAESLVASYSFPLPITARSRGRVGNLRSGRMIYEFIDMTEDDLASQAYKFAFIVKADIKNFYPSIYTHSIAWALHGKSKIRRKENVSDFTFLGNRLDKLFQNANDGCTNGIPIGPVVSDIIAEIIAASVDRVLSRNLREQKIDCAATRFKDDYRILVKSDTDGRAVIKFLQAALRESHLELSDEKTSIQALPAGLFREWVSRYHAIQPHKRACYSWKQFRELYLGVIDIDRKCPGTGVIDRFLADIVSKGGKLKLTVDDRNLQRVISMLLLLGSLRIKAFPKIIAILESIVHTQAGARHRTQLVEYVHEYLRQLAVDEYQNKYLIAWLLYFLVSNGEYRHVQSRIVFTDPVLKSIAANRGVVFARIADFTVFRGSRSAAKAHSMLEYLDVFNPPQAT